MLKRVLFIGVGATVGWLGHTVYSRGRDAAVVRAEESLRTTFNPETLGQQAGQAAASALTSSARSFVAQLRQEVPDWRTAASFGTTQSPGAIRGETTDAPSTDRPSDPRKQR